MIQVFMKTQPSEKQELIKAYLANANISDRVFQDSITRTESLLHSGDLSTLFEAFNRFIIKQSTNDATWRFWKDFIFTDFTAYLALYVAIRTRHWTLRMAGLKEMAPTFWAFDRTTYCKLIPDHISDLKTFPPEVLHSFMQGCFSVAFTERISHCVALDEAHEMGINKGTKQLVVRPTEENMHRISCVMHYRSKIHEMVKHIVKVGDSELGQSNHLPDKVSTKNYYTLVKVENNVLRM